MTAASTGLTGVWVDALIPLTPESGIHHKKWATHVRTLGVQGVQGVVLFGPAGEGLAFSATERLDAVRHLMDNGISGRDMLLHAGFPSVAETVAVIRQAHQMGVRACIVTPPRSEDEPTHQGLAQYFDQIVTQTQAIAPRLYLSSTYRSGPPALKPNVISEVLAQHPDNFVGLIDQTRNASHQQDWIRLFATQLPVHGNNDIQAPTLARMGIHTCLSSFANLLPSVMVALVTPSPGSRMSAAGSAIESQEPVLMLLAAMLEGLPEVPALKYLMSQHYHDAEWQRVRPPLSPLLPESQEKLFKDFRKITSALKG